MTMISRSAELRPYAHLIRRIPLSSEALPHAQRYLRILVLCAKHGLQDRFVFWTNQYENYMYTAMQQLPYLYSRNFQMLRYVYSQSGISGLKCMSKDKHFAALFAMKPEISTSNVWAKENQNRSVRQRSHKRTA